MYIQEHTGQELPVRELGFEAPHELCLSMADTILQVAYVEHGEYRGYRSVIHSVILTDYNLRVISCFYTIKSLVKLST